MAYPRTQWYVNTAGYNALTAWSTGATIAAGVLRRATAPVAGNERVFVAIVAGTTHATTEPTWVLTRGAKTTDNASVTWQECTGQAATNGDITNTVAWSNAQIKNTAISLGVIIKNVAATHYFICSTAGTAGNGSEPSWGTTAGNTTADNTATWTCIGAVGSFTGGMAPHIRIANAALATWGVVGDTICVGDNHAYNFANTYTLSNASSTPFYVICHNHSGNYPPTSADLTTGAVETSTNSNGGYIITAQALYVQGVEFSATGSNANVAIGNSSADAAVQRFKNCKFSVASLALVNTFLIGNSTNWPAPNVYLENTTFKFAATSHKIFLYSSNITWEKSTAIDGAGTVPTNLIAGSNANSQNTNFLIRGVDISAMGSGKNLVSGVPSGQITFLECKLGASVTVSSTGTSAGAVVDLINCDSGATNYRNERWSPTGTLTTETTIIRTGGASDGTTAVAGKIVTSASALWAFPFEAPPIAIWNETVGSAVTVTLYGVWGGGAVPNNDDFWIDCVYPGSSATPIASFATSGKADVLAAGTALASDSSTWGGSTTKFKTSVTITPRMKGYIYVHPKMAKVSTTLYYDPKLEML